jgi:DNA-binding response OmpR family regulator
VVGDITVDFRRYEARKAGTPFDMTRREFQILQALASRPGEVVTRDELLNQVWGLDASPTTRTIDNHIAGLRAKLEADPDEPRRILTVRGVGYKWLPDE